jgi:hypothetical protein
MLVFIQKIEMTGVNPSVQIPDKVMQQLFKQSGREKGPFPVNGMIEGKTFTHKIVKFQGVWLMYLNTPIRDATHIKVGDTITISLEFHTD